MSMCTNSKFYYGPNICASNNKLYIDEGLGVQVISIQPGARAISRLALDIQEKLNSSLFNFYSVSLNRKTRQISITSSQVFELIMGMGDSALTTLGFEESQLLSGSHTYTGNVGAGCEYRTQFPLQDFQDFTQNGELNSPSVSETICGEVEQISFGTNHFMEFSFRYVTNKHQACDSFIRNNKCGVEQLESMLEWMLCMGSFEFIRDESDVNRFEVIRLEAGRNISYELRELYARGLPEYFETRTIRFRHLYTGG